MNQTPSLIYYFRDFPIAVTHEEVRTVLPAVYVCPRCGDVWASIQHSSFDNELARYNIVARYCDLHMEEMWFAAVPGCFFNIHIYPDVYRGVPREILQHDFLMHSKLREIISAKAISNP